MIQKRYIGFLETPFLWKGNAVSNLHQFEISSKPKSIDVEIDETLRLGKYIERLVSFELNQQENIRVLAENIQIQQNKITLGELDCLLLKNTKPIHLEIIYKFYLYDPTVGYTEIDHFIGPNRKDSLVEKLHKLKHKQLPLLYSDACKAYLKMYHLTSKNMNQHVYFKAQLFMPFSSQNTKLKILNNDCVFGFYMNHEQLDVLKDCKFYIPDKQDWLIIPHPHVDWLSADLFKDLTKDYAKRRFSSLCWVKYKSGEIKKMFLVWW